MNRRKILTIFALTAVGALVALLAACGGDDAGSEGKSVVQKESGDSNAATDSSGVGGTLRIALSAGNIPIPNQIPNEGFEGRRFVGFQIYDSLVLYNVEQGDTIPEPKPALAESWQVSADNLTWTFNLRHGVKFHDGSAFDADAAVFAFDRLSRKDFEFYDDQQRAAAAGNFAQIASFAKTGDMAFSITTKKPYSFLLYDLALIHIPSPTAIKTYGNKEYINHPTGTGPFKVTKYVDGQVLEMDANKDYWGSKPRLDKLVLYPLPEPATRLAALQSGKVDWAEVPPPDSLSQLKNEGFNVLLKQYPHVITYQLNTTKPPFNDVRVRQALNYAADRAGTVTLLNGVAAPATQYLPKGHPYYDETWAGYSYDPVKAKQLLAEAGFPNGFKMSIAYPTGGSGNMFPGPMNEKLQQDLKAVGIDATLVPLEWNNIITGFRAGLQSPEWSKYDALYISLAPISPTALNGYISSRIPPAGCCNASGYSNPAADALFSAAEAEFDPAKQADLLKQFQSTFMKDAPVLVTVHDLNLRALSPKVRGFVQPQSWFANLKSVWIKN